MLCHEADEFDKFVQYFPNLETLVIPKFHQPQNQCYLVHPQYEFTVKDSGIWSIFSKPYYWLRLKHIELNLLPLPLHQKARISIEQHPLFHIHKFKNLQRLKLQMRRSKACCMHLSKMKDTIHSKLEDLTELSLHFNNYFAENETVCGYILSFSPNVQHYTFLNAKYLGDISYDHLVGHTDKLKTVCVNSCDFFRLGLNYRSLRSLHIVYDYYDVSTMIESMVEMEIFKFTPNLESVIFSLNQSLFVHSDGFHTSWNDIVYNLISCLRHARNLQGIRLQNTSIEKRTIGTITKEASLKICKLLTSLNHIGHIQIHPLRLKRTELEYLSFWFDGAFGRMETKNELWNQARDTVLLDVNLKIKTLN